MCQMGHLCVGGGDTAIFYHSFFKNLHLNQALKVIQVSFSIDLLQMSSKPLFKAFGLNEKLCCEKNNSQNERKRVCFPWMTIKT